MKVVLELRDQPSNIKKVTVRHDIVIGRGAECNLRLSAPQVSRRHCFLRIGGDSVTVTDLDSSNGTFLNGEKLTSSKRHPLEDGTQLSVGPVQFTVRVLSEVHAGDLLEVKVNDERIEAEGVGKAFDDSSAAPDFEATIADVFPESGEDSMNFAVESGGVAAHEDDPTADYLATDELADGGYFSDVDSIIPASDAEPGSKAIKGHIVDTDEPVTLSADDGHLDVIEPLDDLEVIDSNAVEEVDEIVDAEAIEVINVIDEVDIVEDVDVELDEEVDVIEPLDEVEEFDEVDQVDEVAIVDEVEKITEDVQETPDEDEEDLRNFLKGLD